MRPESVVLTMLLALVGCSEFHPQLSVQPTAFQRESRIALVAFDSYDWNGAALLGKPNPEEVRATLEAAHTQFLSDLGHRFVHVEDLRTPDACKGPRGDFCKSVSIAALTPVNLSPSLARSLGTSSPADLFVEVHVVFDQIADTMWTSGDRVPVPTVFVRAFDASGTRVWEDQESLRLLLTLDREAALRHLEAEVSAATRRVVARLLRRTGEGSPPSASPRPQSSPQAT